MQILTLTLNPAFDMHCYTEHFVPYHENLAHITDYEAGGKGVNISRALTACGIPNIAFVVLGEENGDAFCSRLLDDGMTFREIRVPGRIRENITLHTEHAPETRISFEGASLTSDLLSRMEGAVLNTAHAGDIITLTGRMPTGLTMTEIKAFVARLCAAGIRVAVDSRSFALADLLETKPFLIKPNQEEIAAYLGRDIDTFDQVREAAEDLHRAGIENVMISLGEKGALLSCDGGTFVASAPAISPVSTIGAGDSSIAGFLAACVAGYDARDSLRMAVAYGSAACLTPGTRPPRPGDVSDFYQIISAESR